jgi:DNA-binding response OmpR family regulator
MQLRDSTEPDPSKKTNGEPADLILLDIMLPYLDGFELRALQKRSPLVANIPVLVISAYDLDPQSVVELGLPPPLRKPLDVPVLLSRIRDLTAAL